MNLQLSDSESTTTVGPVIARQPVPALSESSVTDPACDFFWLPTPIWKRGFDLCAASMLLVLLAPLLAAIAIYIRWVSPGRSIFTQSRLGWQGKEFVILKFRTMHEAKPEEESQDHRAYVAELVGSASAASKPAYHNRLIRGGRFLRSCSLDELPQLINVIRGDMSLIGPRPDVLGWEDYPSWQRQRFAVLPGITGLWQVSGKNSLPFDEMVRLDLHYIRHRSIKLDAWILLRTVKLVLTNKNH